MNDERRELLDAAFFRAVLYCSFEEARTVVHAAPHADRRDSRISSSHISHVLVTRSLGSYEYLLGTAVYDKKILPGTSIRNTSVTVNDNKQRLTTVDVYLTANSETTAARRQGNTKKASCLVAWQVGYNNSG